MAGGLELVVLLKAPLGYFDPLGLSKDGDVETFRRRLGEVGVTSISGVGLKGNQQINHHLGGPMKAKNTHTSRGHFTSIGAWRSA